MSQEATRHPGKPKPGRMSVVVAFGDTSRTQLQGWEPLTWRSSLSPVTGSGWGRELQKGK